MQEFFINKNSKLPILQLELIKSGRFDYNKFHEHIQNADIYFTMTDIGTGMVKVAHQKGEIFLKDGCYDEYYIGYVWKEKDTNREGRYLGEFEIIFPDYLEGQIPGNLIVPIREELIINVKNNLILKR